MKNFVYKIHIEKFFVHNSNLKRGHKATLIANNFCNDSRLRAVPLSHRWMFLGMLLICGDQTRDTIEVHEKDLRDLLESSKSVDGALSALQELQLLSYDKIEFFINRIEKKRNKDNKKEETIVPKQQPLSERPAPDKSAAHPTRVNIFIAKYCELFKQKYGVNPEISRKDAGIAKRLASEFTEEKQAIYLSAFFSMPDAWLMKNKHPLNLFETKKNEIVVFANSGKFTTQQQANQLDKSVDFSDKLNLIREGKA